MPEFVLLDVLATAAREPPTEFRLFRAGPNPTRKGVFLFDASAADAVQANSATWGVDHAIDYHHGMVAGGATPDPSQTGKAAGWFKLSIRDGELWATDVRWTPAAAQAIREGEWRYVSPYFSHDADKRVTEILNVAITNIPATHNATPLVSLSLVSDAALHTSEQGSNKSMTEKAMCVALGLAETASDAEAVARAMALSVAAKQVESLTSENASLTTELHALKTKVAEQERAALTAEIDAAIKAGKLPPSQRQWALDLGKTAPQSVRDYLSTAPVQASAHREPGVVREHTRPVETKPGADAAKPVETVQLSAEDESLIKQFNTVGFKLTPADMAKGRAALNASAE